MSTPILPAVLSHPSLQPFFAQAIQRLVKQILGECDYESEYCSCREAAVVIHLESDQGYCLKHFRKVVGRA